MTDIGSNGATLSSHEAQSSGTNLEVRNIESNLGQPKRKAEEIESDRTGPDGTETNKRKKGTAPIKAEYLVQNHANEATQPLPGNSNQGDAADDDAAEAFHHIDRQPGSNNSRGSKRQKNQGQNKARKFGSSRDEVALCTSRVQVDEFSPKPCPFGDTCRYEHDIRIYLKHKREDVQTFGGICPVFEVKGYCPLGWKCRFLGSHSKEISREDGRKELVLVKNAEQMADHAETMTAEEDETGVANVISAQDRILLTKKKFPTPKSDAFLKWLESNSQEASHQPGNQGRNRNKFQKPDQPETLRNSSSPEPMNGNGNGAPKADNRAAYVEVPFRPSEKRRLYFGAETPLLAPLTTQGNLPFRRLCTSLGAAFTYSEMAMSMPIIQGQKSEWALMKAHESEVQAPTFTIKDGANIVYDYDQSHDIRLGAQIAANKPWLCIKATEVLTTLLPKGLRCIDLNVGCPIDLVCREGAGSALMDSPHKLEKMLRGMNAVSGETPVTVKIRMGTKDKHPTAQKLVDRLVLGNEHNRGDPCGVAAITLHGRSRQQRYTRSADWEYIADTANLIKKSNTDTAALVDTAAEPDERDQPNAHKGSKNGKVYFIGNGDVYSHEHFNDHINHAGVDGVMVARGALIKPWIFEEIAAGQYLDKSSTERLQYVEKFCRYGLEAWGSDEIGVGQTRRFVLEWLSFACRYVPVGLLEYLPPSIQDRPPRYKGRDDLETLMASDNFQDWIKISEMFLGPAHKDFRFEPKHKSNSYEIQAEG